MWVYNYTMDWGRSPDFSYQDQAIYGVAGAAAGATGYGVGAYLSAGSLGAAATGTGVFAWGATATIGVASGAAEGLAFQATADVLHGEFSGAGAYGASIGTGALAGGVLAPAGRGLGQLWGAAKGRLVAPKEVVNPTLRKRILGRHRVIQSAPGTEERTIAKAEYMKVRAPGLGEGGTGAERLIKIKMSRSGASARIQEFVRAPGKTGFKRVSSRTILTSKDLSFFEELGLSGGQEYGYIAWD
jgi:hypothetical protein